MPDARPHDLVRIDVVLDGPPWVRDALRRAPWVVVRRAPHSDERVPVGVRGALRSQRHAAFVEPGAIVERLTPPDLVGRIDRLPDVPAARAARRAAGILGGLRWGPAGSVGFTLASGLTAVTADSDLDIVIALDALPPAGELADIGAALGTLPARVDCQISLPAGGVALDELVSGASQVLVRTNDGPILTDAAPLWP
jgi:phosphoribosyl-dephospho-CoA transferase